MATKTRMINPAPAGLMIVNPTGGKGKMHKNATKTQHRRTRRNPTNKLKTRRRQVRRNPQFNTGLLFDGLTLAAGGGVTQFVTAMFPPIGGPSPLADAARTAGAAYLLGILADKIGLSRFSRQITLGGMAVAGGKLINSFLMPFASSVFAPRPAPAPVNGNGVKGIGARYPGMNPYGALNGIAVQTPGVIPFQEFYTPEMAN